MVAQYLAATENGLAASTTNMIRAFRSLSSALKTCIVVLAACPFIAVSDAGRRQFAKRYTSSPEAYDAFLRAKSLFLARRPETNEEAREPT
jgi:hypothetical protein